MHFMITNLCLFIVYVLNEYIYLCQLQSLILILIYIHRLILELLSYLHIFILCIAHMPLYVFTHLNNIIYLLQFAKFIHQLIFKNDNLFHKIIDFYFLFFYSISHLNHRINYQ
jgi:hypothetical protein